MDVITVVQQPEKGYTRMHFGFVCNGKVSIRNGHRRRYKDYDMRKVSIASGKRLQRLLNSDAVEKHVEFSDAELTPTVYFFF